MTSTINATQILTLGSPAIALVISGSFLCIWKFFDRRAYLVLLACAFLLYASASSMQILHWPNEERLNTVISAAIYLASIACMAEGLMRRYCLKGSYPLAIACLLTWLAVAYFCYAQPSVDAGSHSLNFGIGTILCMASWQIRRARRAGGLDSTIFWVFAFLSCSFFVRSLLTLALPQYFVPQAFGSLAFWFVLQLALVLTGLILALLLFAASLTDMIARLRDDRDVDGLTGLWNRRSFDERLERLIARVASEPHALLLIDIGHFKSINDRYGHAVGDKVLRIVSKLIQGCAGSQALTGRVGGEEFAIVVPAGLAEAHELARRLNRLLTETLVSDLDEGHVITLSTGLTMLQLGDTVSSWMRRADTLLYQAKRDGRNRIVQQAATA
ncbi:GGDEF domain-containing protein [Bordetella avium]|uniref:GGDEF domain-containing protein n=1 Tax=Bordetella avium TaxID=521 RepID=UPI0011C04FBC|nr:GGDEF domain-containing protein [Bordetella avium]WQE34951.1 GGDEF domain-containing protein [Bordetella avium]